MYIYISRRAQDVVAGKDQLETINVTSPFTNYFHSDQSSHARNLETNPRYYQDRETSQDCRLSIALVPKFESVRETRVSLSLHPSLYHSHERRDQVVTTIKKRERNQRKPVSPRFVASMASEQRRPEDHWPHGIAKAVRLREQ